MFTHNLYMYSIEEIKKKYYVIIDVICYHITFKTRFVVVIHDEIVVMYVVVLMFHA